MQRRKKLFITIISVLLSFFVYSTIFTCIFYIPCLSYSAEESVLLSKYFNAIKNEPKFTNATNEYHNHYLELGFSYGDVILELAEYDYFFIEQDEALKILEEKNLDSNAYQVNVILYSYAAKQKTVSNIVYFEYENDIYALVFYYADDAYVGEYRAIFKTNMEKFPSEFSNNAFQNHNLIENLKLKILRAALIRGIKIATLILVFKIIIVIILIKKSGDNHGAVRSHRKSRDNSGTSIRGRFCD